MILNYFKFNTTHDSKNVKKYEGATAKNSINDKLSKRQS